MTGLQRRHGRTISPVQYSDTAVQGVVWILKEGWFRSRAKLSTVLLRAKWTIRVGAHPKTVPCVCSLHSWFSFHGNSRLLTDCFLWMFCSFWTKLSARWKKGIAKRAYLQNAMCGRWQQRGVTILAQPATPSFRLSAKQHGRVFKAWQACSTAVWRDEFSKTPLFSGA